MYLCPNAHENCFTSCPGRAAAPPMAVNIDWWLSGSHCRPLALALTTTARLILASNAGLNLSALTGALSACCLLRSAASTK